MSELKAGDCIRVRTGSVIPVDGEVTDGEAYVNEASMTGEPLAVMKSAGSSVFAGTVIEEGSIVIKVRSLSSDTKISRIIELIDNSENLKAGVQSKAERLADSIVPYSFLGFILTLALTRNVTKAVSVLMVDYSCAIKLSTPIAVISAIKQAADCDITVKGGKYLEEFAIADSIVFDKTGTLTNAEPVLEKVIALGDYSEEDTLKIAACLEEHFPHSVARAIVKGAAVRGIDHAEEHAEVQYIVAHGISTTLHGKPAVIGSKHFICEDEGVEITEDQQREIDEKSGACSVVYLAVGGKLTGALCISDPPRAEAKRAIELLKESGIENIVMLTGDSAKAAEITAEKLGITSYHAQVLPEDKHSWVERLKEEGHRVIMVGDGINDAPALAAADVGIGSDERRIGHSARNGGHNAARSRPDRACTDTQAEQSLNGAHKQQLQIHPVVQLCAACGRSFGAACSIVVGAFAQRIDDGDMCEEHDPAERQRKIRHELQRFFEMEDAAFLCISTDFAY